MNWKTWKASGKKYIAVDRGDVWHIISEDGENFGAWQTIAAFRKLQGDGNPDGFIGLDLSCAKLSVLVLSK